MGDKGKSKGQGKTKKTTPKAGKPGLRPHELRQQQEAAPKK
jgi:hypothetical protein